MESHIVLVIYQCMFDFSDLVYLGILRIRKAAPIYVCIQHATKINTQMTDKDSIGVQPN